MSGTADNECVIRGDNNICPGDISLNFAGENIYLDSTVSCPFDSVLQSDFITASQLGLCNCSTAVKTEVQYNRNAEGKPVECTCYACPRSPTPKIGYAFQCEEEIAGPCRSFNCQGICNGELDFFNNGNTRSPTMAPTSGSVQYNGSTVTVLLMLFLTVVAPIIRH